MPAPLDDLTQKRVDDWIEHYLITEDEALLRPIRQAVELDIPPISVSPTQGAFLKLLSQSIGAKRILEIGCLLGYSTIWLARSLPEGGKLVSLDIFERNVRMAGENCEFAGVRDKVEFHCNPAERSLNILVNDGVDPFDLIFMDADKVSYPIYFDRVLHLSKPGTVIIADNIIRKGEVADPSSPLPAVRGINEFMKMVQEDDRLEATAMQTVGSKGHDGFAMIRVK